MKIIVCEECMGLDQIACREFIFPDGNPDEWRGVTVLGGFSDDGSLSPLTRNLLASVRIMADEYEDKAQILLIGDGLVETSRRYFSYADRVFVYDDPEIMNFDPAKYAVVFCHFIENYKPAALFIQNSESMRPLLSAVLTKIGNYLGCTAEVSEFKLSVSNPVSDPHHRGELVICEIPDSL